MDWSRYCTRDSFGKHFNNLHCSAELNFGWATIVTPPGFNWVQIKKYDFKQLELPVYEGDNELKAKEDDSTIIFLKH